MRAASISLILPALLAGAIAFSPADLDAQARGKGNDKDARNRGGAEIDLRPRPELQRRVGNGAGKVPPGWCQGRGNPHNTPENCGYRATRIDPRDRDRFPRAGTSFEEAHTRFHRDLNRRCRARAEQRPLDLEWQVRVRTECRAEHDRWHERHDPDWRR